MTGVAERVRVLGSLALALCHLADGRLDAVASLRPRGARAIDIAAGQLLVREAGAAVALPDAPGPFGAAPLDLEGRSRIVAARDDRSRGARRRAARHRPGSGPGGPSRVACRREQPRHRRAPDGARAGHRSRAAAQRGRARNGRRGRRRRAPRARHDPADGPRLPAQVQHRGAGADARRRRARRGRRLASASRTWTSSSAPRCARSCAAAAARASARSPWRSAPA